MNLRRLTLRRGRYIVYRIEQPEGRPLWFGHLVSRHWRLKAALSAASEVAFEGRGDAQVHWRTGRRTGRTYTLKGIAS